MVSLIAGHLRWNNWFLGWSRNDGCHLPRDCGGQEASQEAEGERGFVRINENCVNIR